MIHQRDLKGTGLPPQPFFCLKISFGNLNLNIIYSQGIEILNTYPVSSTIYNQKKNHFMLVSCGTTTTYSSLNTKFLLTYFNIS